MKHDSIIHTGIYSAKGKTLVLAAWNHVLTSAELLKTRKFRQRSDKIYYDPSDAHERASDVSMFFDVLDDNELVMTDTSMLGYEFSKCSHDDFLYLLANMVMIYAGSFTKILPSDWEEASPNVGIYVKDEFFTVQEIRIIFNLLAGMPYTTDEVPAETIEKALGVPRDPIQMELISCASDTFKNLQTTRRKALVELVNEERRAKEEMKAEFEKKLLDLASSIKSKRNEIMRRYKDDFADAKSKFADVINAPSLRKFTGKKGPKLGAPWAADLNLTFNELAALANSADDDAFDQIIEALDLDMAEDEQ